MATYQDPTVDQALATPDYTTGAGLIDSQSALNERTYAQNRADTIRSYQDTLDSLNFGLKQAGLQARSAYAGRNLYNASGDLSGTGEMVGTELTKPITDRILSAQQAHEANLNKLAIGEEQGRLNTNSRKVELLQGVLGNLRKTATDTYNASVKAENDQIVKKAKSQEDNAKLYNEQIQKSRPPLTLKEATRRRNAGLPVYSYRDSNGNVHNFGASPQEEAALKKAQKTSNGTKPSTTSLQRSNAYDQSGKQIGYALYNPKTGQTTYQNIGGNMSIDPSMVAGVGSAPKNAVNPQVRSDLVDDINGGATLDQLFNAYPEMSVSEITSIYNSL